jgi:hypothetical protein
MKIRSSILFLVAIVAVATVLALWHGKKKQVETNSVETQAGPSANSELHTPAASSVVLSNAQVVSTVIANINTPKPPPGSKIERTKDILATYNDQPIVFYGKLEDQFSNVVSGAMVGFDVRVMNGQESTIKRSQVVSDADGLFTISGYHGQDLSIVPKKSGYALASLNGGGNYSQLYPDEQRVHPDPNNPVVIRMWKLQGAEPLVGIDKTYKLPYSAAPINFDLLAGQIVPSGGDIKLMVYRTPGVMSGRNRLDWSIRIEAIDGGLMDSSGQEAVAYAAPESGYLPGMTFNFATNAPNKWEEGFNQGFFLMSRNGQVYSKLGLSFRINEETDGFMYVKLTGIANVNGSRNWEGAPNTLNPAAN